MRIGAWWFETGIFAGRRQAWVVRWAVAGFALAGLLAAAMPAAAALCTVDAVPAATLLLPYFEVNLDDPNGLTTLFSVNNAAAPAVLTHVVIWSDMAVPVLAFNLYLTGFDVQTLNLRDLVAFGKLPQTASLGQDPNDTISPRGSLSQDIDFPSCQGQLPLPPLTANQLVHLRNALTGKPSPLAGSLCLGQALGDNIARGYVTVDTVNNCTVRLPGDPGYFAGTGPGGSGDVTDQNVLWGNWYIVAPAHGYATGSTMIAIEADSTNPATSAPARYTFYGRYDGWSGADHREPLATSFAVQYTLDFRYNGAVDVIVWRDTQAVQGPFACPVSQKMPPWYPLGVEGIGVFDEQERVQVSTAFPIFPPVDTIEPFPAATQRVRLNGPAFPVSFASGWLYLDLNGRRSDPGSGPAVDPHAAQAWVFAVQSREGVFATAVDAYRLDSACAANHFGSTLLGF